MMNPNLYAFEAIVKHRTVHAAAASLHLTQTAVTQRIKALEKSLNKTLFIRSRRGMTLTSEGEELHRYCQQVLEMSTQLLTRINGLGSLASTRLRIMAPTSIMRSRIIPACERVMRKFPELNMSFIINDANNIYHHLKSGDAELVILPTENLVDELTFKQLHPEKYILVCSPTWKTRLIKNIIQEEHIIDFDENDNITFNYLKKYQLLKYAKKERHFVNNAESLAYLLSTGLGYSVLTEEFAKPYLSRNEIIQLNEEKIYEHHIALAWYPRLHYANYFSEIIDSIT